MMDYFYIVAHFILMGYFTITVHFTALGYLDIIGTLFTNGLLIHT